MNTVDYIKQYSQLYSDYKSNYPKELDDLDSVMLQYNYIETPSRSELPEQIELHMFWRIPLSLRLVEALESCIEQGVFFKRNPDAYYHVSEKYWPLVRHFTGASLVCRPVKNTDFTYSMELYKNAPLHFDLTEHNYNSVECLHHVNVHVEMCRILDLKCLKYMIKKAGPPHNYEYIAKRGMLDCIAYLHQSDMLVVFPQFIKWLTQRGHLDCIRYIYGLYNLKDHKYAAIAADYGHLDCLKFYYKRGFTLEGAAMNACRHGHLECLKYLRDMPNWEDEVTDTVSVLITEGRLECYKYILEEGISVSESDMLLAVQMGDVEIVKLLESYDTLPDSTDGTRSVKCLKYLRKSGIEFSKGEYNSDNDDTWSYAIAKYTYEHGGGLYWVSKANLRNMSMKCFRYVYEKGYRMNNMLAHFARYGRLDVFKYLHAQGNDPTNCMRAAATGGNIELIAYLRKLDIPWGDSLKAALLAGNLMTIKYMYNRGARVADVLSIPLIYNESEILDYFARLGLIPKKYRMPPILPQENI